MKPKASILIFGGTTEARLLCEFLCENHVLITLSVATEYGKEVISDNPHIEIIAERLDLSNMVEFISKRRFDLVIDATHPYADQVSINIKEACAVAKVELLRLVRPLSSDVDGEILVKDSAGAVAYLNEQPGNILLTTGSKDLACYTKVEEYQNRLFVRVLPTIEVLNKCEGLGIKRSNMICMQGPFSEALNIAMIDMIDAKYVVTKNCGNEGGFTEKLSAAKKTKSKLIIIDFPEEKGLQLEEIKALLIDRYHLHSIKIQTENSKPKKSKRFPMFIDLNDKKVVIVGGGEIAQRRVEVLLSFHAVVHIISPSITDRLEKLVTDGLISWFPQEYKEGYLNGAYLVVAATDNRKVNAEIALEAKAKGISISVADHKDECSFWFPAIAEGMDMVAGLVSNDGDHKKVKKMAEQIRNLLGDE